MDSGKQELRWVLRAQAGDREALDELFKRAQAPLYRRAVDEPTPGHLLTWKFAFGYEGSHPLKRQSKRTGSVSRGKSLVQRHCMKYCHSAILVTTSAKSSQDSKLPTTTEFRIPRDSDPYARGRSLRLTHTAA